MNLCPSIYRLLIFLLLIHITSLDVYSQPVFLDTTAECGIVHQFSHSVDMTRNELAMAGGAVAEDFNGDGWLDLYVLQGGEYENVLYINNRNGTFTDEAEQRGAAIQDVGMGVSAADYDSDGDVDIFFTTLLGPHYLLTNDGNGFFQADTNAITGLRTNAMSPSWGDIDNDGLLDLSVGLWQEGRLGNLFLYHNRGSEGFQHYEFHDTAFTDKYVFSARFADVNNDYLQDLLVTADFGNSQLYLNQGNFIFKRVTETNGTGSDEHGMGSAVGDYDNDGDLDWFVTSIWDDSGDNGRGSYEWGITGNRFYQNQGNGTFLDVTDSTQTRDGNWGWGANFGDLDHDGDLDLFHVTGWLIDIKFNNPFSHIYRFHQQPARLFLNDGTGVFSETAFAAGTAHSGQGRGSLLFDFDNDGDLDIFICNAFGVEIQGETTIKTPGKPVLLQNHTNDLPNWIQVTLQGKLPYHSHGIGSRVYVQTGNQTQMRELHASSSFLSQEPGRIAHFGLGDSTKVDEIRAVWNNGDRVILHNIPSNQQLAIASPFGRLSTRNASLYENITATVSGQDDPNIKHEWRVENQTFESPAAFQFSSPGEKTITLFIYENSTGQLIQTEKYTVAINPTETNVSNFQQF